MVIIREIRTALAPHASEFMPIFLFDAAKIHISAKVFVQCGRAGVLPCMIPAKMTWLLQMLDIRGFSPVKMVLQKEYQARRIRAAGGVVPIADWLAYVCTAVRTVFQGFSPNQAGLSNRTKAILRTGAANLGPTGVVLP